ncbi:hypothetical protein ACTA71_000141 [Dictyostelium dimigraforme]
MASTYECRGEFDLQEENVEGASRNDSEGEGFHSIIDGLKKYDFSKAPLVKTREEIALSSKHKKIPDAFMKIPSHRWNAYTKMNYEVAKKDNGGGWKKVKWNTRCAPVVTNEATYELVQKKGSTTAQTWWSETTASVGGSFKGVDMSVSVSTGYKYEKTYTEETVTGWKEMLQKGDYMLYQNKVVYAYEIRIVDNEDPVYIAAQMNYTYNYDKTCPKAYTRGGLFYFVDFFIDDPFFKPLSTDLYQTFTLDEVSNYLMTDGWKLW